MAQELLAHRDAVAAQLEQIRARAPQVGAAYRDRVLERVRGLLGELDVRVDRNDLIKEVAIFAERSDISEEVVRLASHLGQFQEMMNDPESPGRKLVKLKEATLGPKSGMLGAAALARDASGEYVLGG